MKSTLWLPGNCKGKFRVIGSRVNNFVILNFSWALDHYGIETYRIGEIHVFEGGKKLMDMFLFSQFFVLP